MSAPPLSASKAVPCPTCLVDANTDCYPRVDGDAMWVHSARRALMLSMASSPTLQFAQWEQ